MADRVPAFTVSCPKQGDASGARGASCGRSGQVDDISKSVKLFEQLEKAALQHARLADSLSRYATLADQFGAATSALDRIRDQMAAHAKLPESFLDSISALAIPAFDVSNSISKMFDSLQLDNSRWAAISAKLTPDWSEVMRATDALRMPLLPAESHLAKLFDFSAIAEASLRLVPPEGFALKLKLPELARVEVLARHEAFGGQYRAFFEDLAAGEAGVMELPKQLTELPVVEYLNQSVLVASTSEVERREVAVETEDDEELREELAREVSDELTELVAVANPTLIGILAGARAAFDSRHPDFIRHFTTSYRELFGHLLRQLAPDESVKSWSQDPAHFDKGKPTRRARLLYITRNLRSTFGGFLNADVSAALSFFDSFNAGTHAIVPTFTPEEVVELRVRMEGLLRLMLIAARLGR